MATLLDAQLSIKKIKKAIPVDDSKIFKFLHFSNFSSFQAKNKPLIDF